MKMENPTRECGGEKSRVKAQSLVSTVDTFSVLLFATFLAFYPALKF
jgi:hypothetical protein